MCRVTFQREKIGTCSGRHHVAGDVTRNKNIIFQLKPFEFRFCLYNVLYTTEQTKRLFQMKISTKITVIRHNDWHKHHKEIDLYFLSLASNGHRT